MPAHPVDGLNAAQRQAVMHTHGPCLVLAGAGSGKTRVITQKVAHLIARGTPAAQILAITFTNKAAAEMRERARSLIGRAAQACVIGTFHALGVRMLREDGAAVGLKPVFSILDADDVTHLLKDVGGSVDNATARAWQWAISAWKNQGLNPAQAAALATDAGSAHLATLYARYHERLIAYQAVDFDDLILLPLAMLQKEERVAQKWQARWAHILIDEVQDTNAVQYALLRALLAGSPPSHAPLTAVGDDDQSIYGWRGATLDNLRSLPQDYPGLTVIKLEQNYRSTTAILRAANAVIAPNPKLFPKHLWSELGEGEPVRVISADDDAQEADRVVARIQALRSAHPGTPWRAFAVLYRANHQAKTFEKALRRAQIPYRVSGGTSFFDRAEIKDLCAWFRLWINPDDDPAFLRAVTTPRRGIGHQTLASLGELAGRYRLSLWAALASGSLPTVVSGKALDGLHAFGREVDEDRENARLAVGAVAARRFLTDWLTDLGFERHLIDSEDSPERARARWEQVQDFCDWMAARCSPDATDATGVRTPGQACSLLDVAQTVSLLSTLTEQTTDPDVVTLSTLHAAKGLEWPHVMMVGVCEGLLPFQPRARAVGVDASADDSDPDAARTDAGRIEEERRLMYVGITRAQRTLSVSWPRLRKAARERVASLPSRFIADMALDASPVRVDPRARLRALRDEFAQRAAAAPTSQTEGARS